jgi:hypothetical protein
VKKQVFYSAVGMCAVATAMISNPLRGVVQASDDKPVPPVIPVVFQAAGPTVASIQSTVDQYRAALGAINNGNVPGPLDSGRREINWDGGGSTATSIVPTPFTGFLTTRGALFTTFGPGFVQAPPAGLATTFNNPSYETIFQPFSAVRLFSPIDSIRTDVRFFVPGGGDIPATTTGFGAVFSDVDRDQNGPNGLDNRGNRLRGALVEYFDVKGKLLFSSFVASSPGDASLSFLGIVFSDARIAAVRIRTGSAKPGPDDTPKQDIVMMDDFIFGEPQAVK